MCTASVHRSRQPRFTFSRAASATLCLVLIALNGGPAMPASAQTPRFQQDRFAIGFWVDPPADEGADGRDGYCADLAVMRDVALEHGVPFWNFFNVMPYGPHTDPTEAQLRWQIFASLTYGARGVLYFCYFTPPGAEFPKGGAIIRRDGSRTRHYEQARRLNAAVANLGPTLMQLTSTGVRRLRPDDDAAAVLSGTPVRSVTRAEVDPPSDYLVGSFRHADGRRAVLLQNYRYAFTAWPTVEFDADPGQVVEVSQSTSAEIPLGDDSPDMEGVQVSLDAGEGRLFLLP